MVSKPRCESPNIPEQCGYIPVSSAVRLGEHIGAALCAWWNIKLSRARRMRFGLSAAMPYGWM